MPSSTQRRPSALSAAPCAASGSTPRATCASIGAPTRGSALSPARTAPAPSPLRQTCGSTSGSTRASDRLRVPTALVRSRHQATSVSTSGSTATSGHSSAASARSGFGPRLTCANTGKSTTTASHRRLFLRKRTMRAGGQNRLRLAASQSNCGSNRNKWTKRCAPRSLCHVRRLFLMCRIPRQYRMCTRSCSCR